MSRESLLSNPVPHGAGCECHCLTQAAQGGRDSIPYSYCYHVLQKRYRMTCRHGELEPCEPAHARTQPHIEGEIDAVKAILLRNI